MPFKSPELAQIELDDLQFDLKLAQKRVADAYAAYQRELATLNQVKKDLAQAEANVRQYKNKR
jgi:septation ring formation regulator EzrA